MNKNTSKSTWVIVALLLITFLFVSNYVSNLEGASEVWNKIFLISLLVVFVYFPVLVHFFDITSRHVFRLYLLANLAFDFIMIGFMAFHYAITGGGGKAFLVIPFILPAAIIINVISLIGVLIVWSARRKRN